MNNYSENWKTEKLGNLCKLITKGTTPKTYEINGVNFIKVESITETYSLLSEKFSKISVKTNAILKRSQLENGDILFAIAGSLGKLAVVDQTHLPANTNQALAIVRLKNEIVDREFCKYYLTSSSMTEKIKKLATVGAQPNLSLQQVSDFEIPIPPIYEQKKIAKVLSNFDKLITQLNLKKNAQTNIYQALIADFFLSENKTISKVKIGEICKVKRGASPRPIQSKKWWGKGRGWTRISDITKSHKYLFTTQDHLSPEGEQKSVPIDSGDLILSICATIGLPIIVKTPICIHDGFVWFDGLKESLEIEYAYYFFSSIRNQLLKNRQTGTQGNLNTSIVANIEIPLRKINDQKRICSILNSIDECISRTERKIDKYENLKKSLVNDLLSGRKRVLN